MEEIAIAPQGVEVGEGIKAGALSRLALHREVGSPSVEQPVEEGVQHYPGGVLPTAVCEGVSSRTLHESAGVQRGSSHVKGEVT